MSLTRMGVGGCCCGCSVTVCVHDCAGANLSGATVTILSGAMVVATGTTGSGGCVTLSIPSAGSYTVQAAIGGAVFYSTSASLACGGTVTLTQSNIAAGFGCCSGFSLPLPLTLMVSLCGQMWALTATVTGWYIALWGFTNGTINTPGVAVLTECDIFACLWNGVTLTTADTLFSMSLLCPSAGTCSFLAYAINAQPLEIANALCPSSCPQSIGCPGVGTATIYNNNNCTGAATPVTGTWGPSPSLSFTMPSYLAFSINCIGAAPCPGSVGTITA